MAAILSASGIVKAFRHPWSYRTIPVLDELDLEIDEGEIFGIIGHNGAGKTTTFKIVLGLLRPSRGTISFLGQPMTPELRASIGFLPEQPYFYDYLTVVEMLDFSARLYRIAGIARRQRVAEALEHVRLTAKANAPMRTLSKGLLQRVGIAQAILNRPRLVILDEPMSGLDPEGRHSMRTLIQSLQGDGATVIFSSHILPDAEALCDRVGILVGGRIRDIVRLGPNTGPQSYLVAVTDVGAAALQTLARIAGEAPVARSGTWLIRLPNPLAVRSALDTVRDSDGLVHSITPVQPSLEERFLTSAGYASTSD